MKLKKILLSICLLGLFSTLGAQESNRVQADTTKKEMTREEVARELSKMLGKEVTITSTKLPDADIERARILREDPFAFSNMKIGSTSPDFSFEDVNGNIVTSADLKGKYVLIDVWATWCGPCLQEIPALNEMEKKLHGQDITFMSLSIDGEKMKPAWKKMVKDREMGGIQLLAPGEWKDPFLLAYEISAIPRFILLNKEGKVMYPDIRYRPSHPDLCPILEMLLSGEITEEKAIEYLKKGLPPKDWRGVAAPGFTYKDINGKAMSLSDLKGKYVLIDIWATWCGPCLQEIPHLQALEEKMHHNNIAFVSLSCDEDKAKWEAMVKERQLKGIQLHTDGDREFMNTFRVNGIPRFILLDKEGKVLDANLMTRPSNPKIHALLEGLEGI